MLYAIAFLQGIFFQSKGLFKAPTNKALQKSPQKPCYATVGLHSIALHYSNVNIAFNCLALHYITLTF